MLNQSFGVNVNMLKKICFLADKSNKKAQELKKKLSLKYNEIPYQEAEAIVAIGGDGFMLEVIHQNFDIPIYGINLGSIGFLMNLFQEKEDLLSKINNSQEIIFNPLKIKAETVDGQKLEKLAFNEFSLLRASHQAAQIKISVEKKVKIEKLICDGLIISTPAGSTAYNLSAHGPILPLGCKLIALTPIAAFRPRHWRGAILPQDAVINLEVLDNKKRPVNASADNFEIKNLLKAEISIMKKIKTKILFDPEHNLEERILTEQFL